MQRSTIPSLFRRSRAMNDLMRDSFTDFFERNVEETMPQVNIRETKNAFELEMAAPGLKKEDFKIDLEGNVLSISSEKESETKEGKEEEGYERREYNYSHFYRSFTLPENVNADKLSAKYTDGILKLEIPKKTETKATGRHIKVE